MAAEGVWRRPSRAGGGPQRQWGRDRLAAEGCRGLASDPANDRRQWGRDRLAAEGASPYSPRSASFRGVNGAATVWPRKGGGGPRRQFRLVMRQWGRDRLAAEGPHCRPPYRRPFASMGPRPFGRGRLGSTASSFDCKQRQWGRDRLAAEGPCTHYTATTHPASMGPRPFGRGRYEPRARLRYLHGVNGAATVWPRKGRMGNERLWMGRRVNGAATVWPRKAARGVAALPRSGPRQWGRDRLAAEGPFGLCQTTSSSRVNGAATVWPRKV